MPELNIIGAKEENRYFPYQNASGGGFRVTRKSFYQAGQDSFTQPPAQNPDLFQSLTNIEPILQGTLKRRRGYQLLSPQAPSTPYREGYSFRSEGLGLRSQVWTSTSNVLALNEDGSANVNTLFTPSLNAAFAPRMVLSRDYGYFADGTLTDNLKWDGTQSTGNVTNWGIDINNALGIVTGPNAPGTATDLGNSGNTASQGTNNPTVATNVSAPNWNNPNNIFTSNNTYADQLLNVQTSTGFLRGTGYGFSIPGTATITGITVIIRRWSGQVSGHTGFCIDNGVFLTKAGTQVGTDHSAIGVFWPAFGPSNQTYGSPSDLWGTTWTPTDINNVGFGAQVSAFNQETNPFFNADPSVDWIGVTVYYTTPTTGNWTNPNNIKIQDGAVATTTATTSQSSDLQATNFGLTPSGIVTGIQVDIKLSTSSGTPTINPSLTKNSVAYGTRKIATVTNTGLSFITFGSPTDLWGGTWALSDITSANFGAQFYVLAATGSPLVSVDFIRITIYTSVPPPSWTIAGTGITLLSGRVYTLAFQNSITGHVSSVTPFSTSTGPLTNQGIALSALAVSADPQVDSKLILATADGGDTTTLYLLASIPNATTTYSDTTSDSVLLTQNVFQQTNADGSLHGVINNNRPPAFNFPTKHKGRIYGSIKSTLYFSKNLDEVTTSTGTITSKWEEAFPRTNQLDISEASETIQGIMSDGETLWIATERCIRRLIGDSPSNFQKPEIQFNEAGLLNQDCWKVAFAEEQPVGTMWLTPDFKVIFSDFNNYSDVGTRIQNVLNSINPNAVSTIHAAFVAKGPAEYYMLHIPTGSNTSPDTICVFNMKSKQWCIWSPTDQVSGSLYFIDTQGKPRWIFAATLGSLYEWKDTLFLDRVGNTPVSYSSTAQTSWLDFGDEGLTKAFNKIIVTTADLNLTVGVQGAIRDSDFVAGGTVVLLPTTLLAEIFGDLFIPMVGQSGYYKWYQLTFNSPASSAVNLIDAFDFEIMPLMRM